MLESIKSTDLFCDYYEKWIVVYKESAILDAVDEGLVYSIVS